MSLVTLDEFQRLDIRVGKVVKAERIPGSKKLMKLEVSIGGEVRQIVAGIAETYRPEDLIGRKIVVLVNIQPKRILGIESRGMLLAADVNGRPYLLRVDREEEVPEGTRVR